MQKPTPVTVYIRCQNYLIFVHQQIGRFQIPVDYVILVEVVHSLGNINCNFEEIKQLKYAFLFMKIIIYTSPRHELCETRST